LTKQWFERAVNPLSFVWLSAAALMLAGCGGTTISSTGASSLPIEIAFSGKLMTGQLPIANAAIQLYAAGTSGYGAGAVSLESSSVNTATDGTFSIASTDACPSSNSQIYLVARGGSPVLSTGKGSSNANIVLLAAVGACGSISSSTSITINEVSTVATTYALAGFMGSNAEIGTSSSNLQGLANAFANETNLVDLATAATPGSSTPAGAVIPSAKLNSLAAILSTCVQSSSSCSSLYGLATSSTGTLPANTLDAAINIARTPSTNIAALYALVPTTPPFSPTITAAPNDWTLAISYVGGGLSSPSAIALDSTGNVWVADYFGAITELSPTGAALSPSGGYTGGGLNEIWGLAVDASNNVWATNVSSVYAANNGHGTITEMSSSGQFISGTNGYTAGGIDYPYGIAADTTGNIWVANTANHVATLLNASGIPLSGSTGYGSASLIFPEAVAVDANHNAWFTNQSATSVTMISPDGATVNKIPCCNAPSGIAIDPYNNVWITNYYGNSVSQITTSGTVVSTGYTATSLVHPNGIAVDGAGNVWVANYQGDSVSEILGANSKQTGVVIAPADGYGTDAGLLKPYGVAIDASGNVWVSNFDADTVTSFVGLATPAKTPAVGPAALP